MDEFANYLIFLMVCIIFVLSVQSRAASGWPTHSNVCPDVFNESSRLWYRALHLYLGYMHLRWIFIACMHWESCTILFFVFIVWSVQRASSFFSCTSNSKLPPTLVRYWSASRKSSYITKLSRKCTKIDHDSVNVNSIELWQTERKRFRTETAAHRHTE